MSQRRMKCYVGNYDGQRNGMVYATSKVEAAAVAQCSVYSFNQYWSIHTAWPIAHPKALTLYTRKNDYKSVWQEGICPITTEQL